MRSFFALCAAAGFILAATAEVAPAAMRPSSVAAADTATMDALSGQLERMARHAPGEVAISIVDLDDGDTLSINGNASLPAASTIKVPVMVEVMRQIATGRFTFYRTVSLRDADRDCGYGSLCDAPSGSKYTVWELLWRMITVSDNTAANMLIRLVGRQHINETMEGLGLTQTWLGDSIRSDGDIRALRTSANDMMRLMDMIAQRELINPKACGAMLEILQGQQHNDMLPAWLPKTVVVAHKTGTLHDTLNDVGIVELHRSPYIICVLTTHLADLDLGERFIRRVSLLTYRAFAQRRLPALN